jgi:hypothetical protein
MAAFRSPLLDSVTYAILEHGPLALALPLTIAVADCFRSAWGAMAFLSVALIALRHAMHGAAARFGISIAGAHLACNVADALLMWWSWRWLAARAAHRSAPELMEVFSGSDVVSPIGLVLCGVWTFACGCCMTLRKPTIRPRMFLPQLDPLDPSRHSGREQLGRLDDNLARFLFARPTGVAATGNATLPPLRSFVATPNANAYAHLPRPGLAWLCNTHDVSLLQLVCDPVTGHSIRTWQLAFVVLCAAFTPQLRPWSMWLAIALVVVCVRINSMLDVWAVFDNNRVALAQPLWACVRWAAGSLCDLAFVTMPLACAMSSSFGLDPRPWLVTMAAVAALMNAPRTWWLGQPLWLRLWLRRWRLRRLIHGYHRIVAATAFFYVCTAATWTGA